jgi:two-component system KDP operon response regulator KdpE
VKRGRVLVVDDEEQIRRAVRRALTARDYQVEAAPDAEAGLAAARIFQPDLVILDLNLPGMDGLAATRELRALSAAPILILSVREDESDKVAALDLGADDYLTKPFGVDELMARVRALLRRAAGQMGPRPLRYRTEHVEIDLEAHRVARAGEPVRLTRTEWGLLEALAGHPGKLLTHRWLLERVWGPGHADDLEVLRVFVSQVRRKIEEDPSRPAAIVTDAGIGYRWMLPPDEPESLSESPGAAD